MLGLLRVADMRQISRQVWACRGLPGVWLRGGHFQMLALMPLQSIITERRAHVRQPLRTSAALLLGDGRILLARTIDVGARGAAVVADVDPGEAAEVLLKVRLPARSHGSRLFEAPGKVVNTVFSGREAGFRLSLQFGALDAQASQTLQSFLSKEPVQGIAFVRWY